jgi:hypothetical protein
MVSKVLCDIANTMPHMVGGRMREGDFEALAALPDGVLTIELLSETARHSSGNIPTLPIVAELVAWLATRLSAAQMKPAVQKNSARSVYRSLIFDKSRLS